MPSLWNMQTPIVQAVKKYKNNISSKYMVYFLSFKKHTNNIGSKNVRMTNKVIRQTSMCANCMSNKSRFLKQKPN